MDNGAYRLRNEAMQRPASFLFVKPSLGVAVEGVLFDALATNVLLVKFSYWFEL